MIYRYCRHCRGGSVAESAAYVDLVVAAATHLDGCYRMEGSYDWSKKPGRLTVYVDLDHEMWDQVYDRLAETDLAREETYGPVAHDAAPDLIEEHDALRERMPSQWKAHARNEDSRTHSPLFLRGEA